MAKVTKSFFSFFFKILFAFLLIWVSASVACVLGSAFLRLPWTSPATLVFFGGVLAYFLLQIFLYKPILSHVMAHELTHALAAMLMGGKVSSIQASTTGGTTVTNKSHVFISLAPYVFPFYTAVTLAVYSIAADRFKIYLLFVVGFTYAFHLALTLWSLSHHQPDLQEGGVAFSLIFIFAGNIIVLMLLFSFVWPQSLPLSAAVSQSWNWSCRLASSLYYFLRPYFSHPEA